jgi:hypothetical protein
MTISDNDLRKKFELKLIKESNGDVRRKFLNPDNYEDTNTQFLWDHILWCKEIVNEELMDVLNLIDGHIKVHKFDISGNVRSAIDNALKETIYEDL